MENSKEIKTTGTHLVADLVNATLDLIEEATIVLDLAEDDDEIQFVVDKKTRNAIKLYMDIYKFSKDNSDQVKESPSRALFAVTRSYAVFFSLLHSITNMAKALKLDSKQKWDLLPHKKVTEAIKKLEPLIGVNYDYVQTHFYV